LHAYRAPTQAMQHANSMLGVEVSACTIDGPLEDVAIVHVVWVPEAGPVIAFADPVSAYQYAVETAFVDIQVGSCELRRELPDTVSEDLQSDEYDSDQVTPIELDDIDGPDLKRR
jgi:hypothetical protein